MANIIQLAQQIKSGEYPRQEIDVEQFFNEDGSPIRENRIQVRDVDRDIDRIDRAVNKMKVSGDYSKLEDLTLVKYPNDLLKINNGNHTAEMIYLLKQEDIDLPPIKGCVVDFVKDLGGKLSNALALGNELNKIEVEKVDVHHNDIRNHLYQLMDEQEDYKLSKEQIKEFNRQYPHISERTIIQWISNHKEVGGRRQPLISYTQGELKSIKSTFEKMQKYSDYVVLEPRNLRGAFETGIAQAFRQMKNQTKTKCLVPLFCETVAQANKWEKSNIEEKIKLEYEELSGYYEVTIEYEMLRYA
tara:strand:+ start:651 stop:1553 length:903 start_codon:yes stop_codon:yes gene_type:complete